MDRILETLKSKEFWDNVKQAENGKQYFAGAFEKFEKMKGETPVPQTEGLGEMVEKELRTAEHDAEYFRKRNFICDLALLSLAYPDNDEYIALTEKWIESIFDDYSWAVPSHYIRKFDNDERTCVDLFASETVSMLAEIYVLLEDRLSKECLSHIKANCKHRVFDSYVNRKYYWESGWNNWTPVCVGNIGIAMMRLDPQLFEQQKERILRSMAAYIEAFPNDGNCSEGVSYWQYGFGTWLWFSDTLLDYTDGKINLFDDKKVQSIAAYGPKMLICGGACVNVGDCMPVVKLDVTINSYLKAKYPETCVSVEKSDIAKWKGNSNWVWTTRFLLYGLNPEYVDKRKLQDYYFEDSAQKIVNKEEYSLFVKAGCNDESHNHNDVGSFILATPAYGQIFCDLGNATYFRGYFDDARYTVLNTMSKGHSVPIIDGEYQKFGKEYCGSMVCKDNRIIADFAKAYGEKPDKLIRTFAYGENEVSLTDEFCGCDEVIERFVTLIKPEKTAYGVIVGNVLLSCDEPAEIHETTEEKFYIDDVKTVYLIDYRFKGKTKAAFKMSVVKE